MPPATGGRRITWAQVPAEVVASIEELLGSRVVVATSQPGGFSEALAARVRLADGRRAFVKAASSLVAPAVARFHQREIAISQRLPAEAPVPRLLAGYDDGNWVALLFEEIDGALPAQPWRRDEFERVLTAATDLAMALTPSPVDRSILGSPRLGGWLALASEGATSRLQSLSPWAARHLDKLVGLEEQAGQALAGETLLHGDLYPFNIMLSPDRVFFIDWPHAWIGAAHCDVLTLISSAALSGVDPEPFADTHPLTRHLDPNQINVFLAMHAGILIRLATVVGPAVDHNWLGMVIALGQASLRWLQSRLQANPTLA
ncbi:aminoglycoside phosphotransferase family protein [Micromonospora coerulea]|uniref:aminoglycoside phosphotransferase family protein n=1 Tax=Micromonospora coerulea TaxID=47856 RepID=UPI001903F204|nr:aminoglycoside phosphotransferase family protein [Micromonospora veneta]